MPKVTAWLEDPIATLTPSVVEAAPIATPLPLDTLVSVPIATPCHDST